MAIIKCKMCGGDLMLTEGSTVAECEYCGTVQTVPVADNEKKLTLFTRANRLRYGCEFDKAAGVYESIVAEFPEEAEAYWGLVLCKYGIEYVDDPATGKKIPTCHRSSFDSVTDDNNYDMTLEYADVVARRVYREEAKTIEQIRKGIIEVSSKEDPYDIFICYKETEIGSSDRTLDSVLAQDVYDALTEKGYRVFFSRITLEDKLGVEYEPYIFAALNSAKIMLAFGTDYEHYNAVWVKNEWSRYLKLMAKDKEKHLIPCYKGIDAYDMPKEFAKLQAQDLGKVGATQDLLRGIAKILPQQRIGNPVVIQTSAASSSTMVMRGQFALEDGDWAKADEYFDRALDQNPQDGGAYLGKVLASLRLGNPEQLDTYLVKIHDDKNFDRAIRFSDDVTSRMLSEIRERAHRKYLAKCLTTGLKKIASKKRKEDEQIRLQEAERMALVEKRNMLADVREKVRPAQKHICAAYHRTIGLRSDGNVVTVGSNMYGEGNIGEWSDIVAISAGREHTVGLKSDGTVVAVGRDLYGSCNVSRWSDIVDISTGDYHTVGLKADGTVVAIGDSKRGQCNVSGWSDIVAITACQWYTFGLKSDGTVVATDKVGDCGHDISAWEGIVAISADTHIVGLKADGTVVAAGENFRGECDVGGWTDIVDVRAGLWLTVGLKVDGTVLAVGKSESCPHLVSKWKDVVAISADEHIVGLKADGTVVATGKDDHRQCRVGVSEWTDIVAISAGSDRTIGLRADGTVVSTENWGHKADDYGQFDVSGWKLFNSIDTLDEEKDAAGRQRQKCIEAERLARIKWEETQRIAAQHRSAGLCQHCGGELKGFFTKKCVSCGKPKDY